MKKTVEQGTFCRPLSIIINIMKSEHWCTHGVYKLKCHKLAEFWTLHFVPGYKSPRISNSVLQVALNNIGQKWCPAARQGPIYKPTRSKLKPKRSYNSTGAFWWAYHPMLLLVGFQRINRPENHITGCWLSSLGECTRRMMWGRSDRDTGVYGEFPPCLPRVWGAPLNCHWKKGRGPDHVQPLITVFHCAFHDLSLLKGKKQVLIFRY